MDTKCDVMQEGHAGNILGHVMHHTGQAADPMRRTYYMQALAHVVKSNTGRPMDKQQKKSHRGHLRKVKY